MFSEDFYKYSDTTTNIELIAITEIGKKSEKVFTRPFPVSYFTQDIWVLMNKQRSEYYTDIVCETNPNVLLKEFLEFVSICRYAKFHPADSRAESRICLLAFPTAFAVDH